MSDGPASDQIAEFRGFTESLAELASAAVREQIEGLSLEIKADGSPVTTVDLAVERVLRQMIEERYPAHGILGEEYGNSRIDADWLWVLDPIDGTRQFAAGLANYGVLIALCHRGAPVIGVICQPLIGDLYLGVLAGPAQGAWRAGRPLRTRVTTRLSDAIACVADPDSFNGAAADGREAIRGGSGWNVYDGSCIGFGALAAGRLDLCLCGPNLDPFDICALVPVVEGAGGVITDWSGKRLTAASKGAIVASCTEALHAEALALLPDDPTG